MEIKKNHACIPGCAPQISDYHIISAGEFLLQRRAIVSLARPHSRGRVGQERCLKLPGVGSCRNRAQPFPAGPRGLLHFLTSPLVEKPSSAHFRRPRPHPGSFLSRVFGGGRTARAPQRLPRPASRRLREAPAAFQSDLQPGLARGAEEGERAGVESGSSCAPPRRITVPSFQAPAAGPASRWGPESRRASAREGGTEGERAGARGRRPPSPALSPAPPQPWRSAAPSRRRSAGTRRGTGPGLGGCGWEGGCGAAPGLARRGPGPAARASPGPQGVRQPARRFFVSAVESAPALHAHAPAPGAPTKGTGEEATALTPAPAATADSTLGAPSAPPALHPRLHTHTKAASAKLRAAGHGGTPLPPVGWVGALSLASGKDG